MRKQNGEGIKLRRLVVRNYKVLDSLDIEFPAPRMKGDPDIMIMGSANGLGKTSVLECCAWLFLAAAEDQEFLPSALVRFMPANFADLLVRAGAEQTKIEGLFALGAKEVRLELTIARSGTFRIRGGLKDFRSLVPYSGYKPGELFQRSLLSLFGVNCEPVFLPLLVYFHSYRKVQEGNVDLVAATDGERSRPIYDPALMSSSSTFKHKVLEAMLGRADLLEGHQEEEGGAVLDKLNELMRRFAGGAIERLRPSQDSKIELRVTPAEGRESYNFDGLSSGQKEIISTLFLIWHYTRQQPGIVLIDEPELHLNAEWHHSFIRQLHELAPRNQYIIATHSEDVFGSVPEDRRFLLRTPEVAVR